ncbi:hypothetical protein H2198_001000 [Neophaeococcomyces mojaviensis]|uniref:Uncharacterized protein n=1 Tax=Neophaeococcomyces mojaviensis TaxID=3383035 RepID=A0ACC3AIX9_9EURO|nr:hypothetical protein H2198_001000 [Knufia sp. JES_112]
MVSTRAQAKLEKKQDAAMIDVFAVPPTGSQDAEVDNQKTNGVLLPKPSSSTINTYFNQSKIVRLKCKAPDPPSPTGAKSVKSTPVSAVSRGQRSPNGIVKKTSPAARSTPTVKSLKISFRMKYYDIQPGKLAKMGIRSKRPPKNYYPYPKKNFKLGHNPWAHLNLPKPTKQRVDKFWQLIAGYNGQFNVLGYTNQPAHAVKGVVTVDTLFQTILAQSTGNEMAIDAHSRLCNRFTYLVNGKKYVGTMPNWHKVRTVPRAELERVLKPGGYQIIRAKAIQQLLEIVYAKNTERKAAGVQQYTYDGNPPDAEDFVPGMLSLDYLTDYPEGSDENSDEKLLGRLTQLPLIGFKSAMCIMAFQLKRPIFVVDTHVLRVTKWLGWVPKHAKEDQAAQYLHSIIPDDIKYDLHNQIWTHCANENVRDNRGREVICPFCGSNPPAKGRDLSKYNCPLKDLLPPLSKRWSREYVGVQLSEGANLETIVKTEEDETTLDPSTPKPQTENATQDTTMTDAEVVETTEVTEEITRFTKTTKRTVINKQTTIEAAFGIKTKTDSSTSDLNSSQPSKSKPVKEKKLKLKETMLFDELTPEQAKEAGYLLWEFRPMDNSFMEDWGTFDKMPRYKWEKPSIMDPDVAVTPEHARAVLEGRIEHRWSKRNVSQ